MHICIFNWLQLPVYVYKYVCMYVHTQYYQDCANISRARTHAHTHSRICTWIDFTLFDICAHMIFTHTYTYTYELDIGWYMCIHDFYTHTHIHTHTHMNFTLVDIRGYTIFTHTHTYIHIHIWTWYWLIYVDKRFLHIHTHTHMNFTLCGGCNLKIVGRTFYVRLWIQIHTHIHIHIHALMILQS